MSCTTTTTLVRDFAFSPKETVIHFQSIRPTVRRSPTTKITTTTTGRSLTSAARYGQPTPVLTSSTLTTSPLPMTPTPRKLSLITPRPPNSRRSTLPSNSTQPRPKTALKRRQTEPGPGPTNGLGISGLREWEEREIEREREARKERERSVKINGYTRCGRHSDEWLFGGWGLGKMVKRVISGSSSPERDY